MRTWPDTAALTEAVQCVVDGRAPGHHTTPFPPLGKLSPTIRHSNSDTLLSLALLTALLQFDWRRETVPTVETHCRKQSSHPIRNSNIETLQSLELLYVAVSQETVTILTPHCLQTKATQKDVPQATHFTITQY